jgi:hypothetical protein
MDHVEAIAEYQCTGCVSGPDAPACPQFKNHGLGCVNHVPGTSGLAEGTFYLGLPKGFNRLGPNKFVPNYRNNLEVYPSMDALLETKSLNSIFSLPVWLHIDRYGNTIIRWFSPRVNWGWSTVTLGDHSEHPLFAKAIRITQVELDQMD